MPAVRPQPLGLVPRGAETKQDEKTIQKGKPDEITLRGRLTEPDRESQITPERNNALIFTFRTMSLIGTTLTTLG